MLIKCLKCGSKDNAMLDREKQEIKCKKCGNTLYENAEQEEKWVVLEEDLDIGIFSPGSYMIWQVISDNPEESMEMIMNQELPKKPYEGSKKIKGYKFTGKIRIEAYYE